MVVVLDLFSSSGIHKVLGVRPEMVAFRLITECGAATRNRRQIADDQAADVIRVKHSDSPMSAVSLKYTDNCGHRTGSANRLQTFPTRTIIRPCDSYTPCCALAISSDPLIFIPRCSA